MDPFVLAFYAIVCSALGWAAPNLGGAPLRLAVGAVVGIIAASALPLVRATLGF